VFSYAVVFVINNDGDKQTKTVEFGYTVVSTGALNAVWIGFASPR
jgi:uncharacterized protein Veg